MDPVNDQPSEETPETTPDAEEVAAPEPAAAEAAPEAVEDAPEAGDAPEAEDAPEAAEAPEAAADDTPASSDMALDEIIDMEKLQLHKTISQRDTRISKLEGQLRELTARLRTVSAAYKKQQDDVSATRKRLERHAAQREEVRRGEVVSGLFEPAENLRRSREALSKAGVVGDNLKGLDMVITQFMSAFEGLGLEEVPGKGARFDPNLHEALTTMPVMDPALDDVVVEVFSVGYRVGNRLIQPARVIVGRYTAPEPEVVEEAEEVVDAEEITEASEDAEEITEEGEA